MLEKITCVVARCDDCGTEFCDDNGSIAHFAPRPLIGAVVAWAHRAGWRADTDGLDSLLGLHCPACAGADEQHRTHPEVTS
ncbi:hypothetical protein FHX42_004478 [Saccharopolyspora lacisalsi]|uniref:Uncharacterized protein n=1 Tax=Halosaccharopolyspora lacisalsi TaxID=1000566 RepID=A0A839E006_9PSEU|nr:hypothetical protein [Halosaccharopolyspora lacisalsi]MBA8827094.1 hypothetical protein [Halosaccharopolyspora lacisalsi]